MTFERTLAESANIWCGYDDDYDTYEVFYKTDYFEALEIDEI